MDRDALKTRMEDYYLRLLDSFQDQMAVEAIGSTFRVPLPDGRGSQFEAQLTYLRDILELVFDAGTAGTLLPLARAVQLENFPEQDAIADCLAAARDPKVAEQLQAGIAVAQALTGGVRDQPGTDLFVNVLFGLDAALQMYGVETAAIAENAAAGPADDNAADQDEIDAMFEPE